MPNKIPETYILFCVNLAEVLGCDYITASRIVDRVMRLVKKDQKKKEKVS